MSKKHKKSKKIKRALKLVIKLLISLGTFLAGLASLIKALK